jgi:hypothetical protein
MQRLEAARTVRLNQKERRFRMREKSLVMVGLERIDSKGRRKGEERVNDLDISIT